MADRRSRPRSWQVINNEPLEVLNTSPKEPLSNLNKILDSRLDHPFRVWVDGTVIHINGSQVQTLKSDGNEDVENSFKISSPPILGKHTEVQDSALDLSDGSVSGDFATPFNIPPSISADDYIWLGIELRIDGKFHLVWGQEDAVEANATTPIFTSGDSILAVLLQSDSGGLWDFKDPVESSFSLFINSSPLEIRDDVLYKVRVVDLVSTTLPVSVSIAYNDLSGTISNNDLVLFTQPSIEGIYRAIYDGITLSWEKIVDPQNGANVQAIDGTSYLQTLWKKVNNIWRPVEVADAVKEPSGFPNRIDTTFSINNGTRTFTISPIGDYFDYFNKGVAYRKSAAEPYIFPDLEGSHFIYFDGETLTSSATFDEMIITEKAYVAHVYWDQTNQEAIILGDERHGITMDGDTHKYLHLTRGTVLQSGMLLGSFTLGGSGFVDSDAQISVGDTRLFDEDIDITIEHNSSPSDFFQQILDPIAEIPVYYRQGTDSSGIWRKDLATQFPLKQGTSRIQWNKLDLGTWTTEDASSDGNYVTSWIFATNNVTEPIIAVLGQAEYSSLSLAQEQEQFSFLNFGEHFPTSEFKLGYRIIWRTDSSTYSNTPSAIIADIQDLRVSPDAPFPTVSPNDHGLLTGLNDPDHAPTAVTTAGVTKDGGLSASDTDLQQSLDTLNKLFGQLRLQEHPSNKKRVVLTGATRLLNNGTELGQTLGSLIASFEGAEIDFSTGNIFESDGVTSLGINFTPATIPSSEYQWYSVSLVANASTSENTLTAQVLVIPAPSSDVSKSAAPRAPFSTGGQKIGQVVVQESSPDIDDISQDSIIQLGIGTGSGGGGDASLTLGRLEDYLDELFYEYMYYNVFSLDTNTKIGTGSTGTFSYATNTYDLNTTEELFTNNVLDEQFLLDQNDLSEVSIAVVYKSGEEDSAPVARLSRNGGGEYQDVTLERVGSLGSTYFGTILFEDEMAMQNLHEYAIANEDDVLALDNSGTQALSQRFTVDANLNEVLQQITIYLNKLGTPTGFLKLNLHENNAGDPGDILHQSLYNIANLSAGNNTLSLEIGNHVLAKNGLYHFSIETDAEYKASYVGTTHELRVRIDSSSPTIADAKEYDGVSWSETVGNVFTYILEGRYLDLRLNIEASEDSKIDAVAVYFGNTAETISGVIKRAQFVFHGTNDNLNEFNLPWDADPDFLESLDIFVGQTFIVPAFELQNNKAVFPVDFFDGRDQVILIFRQIEAGSFDGNPELKKLAAENYLGSQDPTIDRSVAGRGNKVRTENTGLLTELTLNEDTELVLKQNNIAVHTYYNTDYLLTVAGTNSYVNIRSIGLPYETSTGQWRIKFNIVGTKSSSDSCVLTITGITFKNIANYNQACSLSDNNGSSFIEYCYAVPNSATIQTSTSAASTTVYVSGDVELESKPTFVP